MAQRKYVSLNKLSSFLDNLKNTFAHKTHTHTISEITDISDMGSLTVDTELSSTSDNPVANSVINAEFDAISDAMGALEMTVDGKADVNHNHDDIYYTETEIDNKLETKVSTHLTVNGKELTSNITLTASDVGLGNVDNKSSETLKSEFTGKLEDGNTGFATGDMVYDVSTRVTTLEGAGHITQTQADERYALVHSHPYVPSDHLTDSNPHNITKETVGLGSVENKSVSEIQTELKGSVASGNTGFVIGGDVYTIKTTADTAKTTADTAKTTADTAKTTADGHTSKITALETWKATFGGLTFTKQSDGSVTITVV